MGRQRFNLWELTHGAGEDRVTSFRYLFAYIGAASDPFPQAVDAHPVLSRLPWGCRNQRSSRAGSGPMS